MCLYSLCNVEITHKGLKSHINSLINDLIL